MDKVDRLEKIKYTMKNEEININYVFTPSNKPLLILKGGIILGHTEDMTENNQIVHLWKRVNIYYPSIRHREIFGKDKELLFIPFLL